MQTKPRSSRAGGRLALAGCLVLAQFGVMSPLVAQSMRSATVSVAGNGQESVSPTTLEGTSSDQVLHWTLSSSDYEFAAKGVVINYGVHEYVCTTSTDKTTVTCTPDTYATGTFSYAINLKPKGSAPAPIAAPNIWVKND